MTVASPTRIPIGRVLALLGLTQFGIAADDPAGYRPAARRARSAIVNPS